MYDFQGFETRGTVIAQRLTAWDNLLQATRPSGLFAVDPRDLLAPVSTPSYNVSSIRKLHRLNKQGKKPKRKKYKKKDGDEDAERVRYFFNKFSISYCKYNLLPNKKAKEASKWFLLFQVYIVATQRNFSDDSIKKQNRWKALQELTNSYKIKSPEHDHAHVSSDGFFCGTPDQRYSRVVVSSMDGSSLFTYKSMMAICHIERQLIQNDHFTALCDTIKKHRCCHPWSIVNYVALLHNRTSCLAITEQDISATLILLQACSPFYHNLQLTQDCNINNNNYCQTPAECSQYNAVFNILHYLTDIGFLPPNGSDSANNTHLKQSMIFLPIGCSTKTMDYYHELERKILSHNNVKVVAMEFGLKSALFDEYLLRDTWLIFSGVACVLVCMWIYTDSLFLTLMTIIAIVFSLGISYFMYTLVFELNFFPFMNLLATIVVVGIGADDVFIFCKVWYLKKLDRNISETVVQLMTKTFQHAMLSMLVTSLTTAAAFYSSLISSITTVCCFSVFAGTAIIANFFLMLTWLPASVVVSERWGWTSRLSLQWKSCDTRMRIIRISIDRFWSFMEKFLLFITLRFRYFWLIFLTLVAFASTFVVLKYPGLQLPESLDFQLFESSHPFEQYDIYYKHRFWYERQKVSSLL